MLSLSTLLSWLSCSGLDLDAQDMSTGDTMPDDREVDPKENFIQHHTMSGTFDESGTPTDAEGGLLASVSCVFTDFAGAHKPCGTVRPGIVETVRVLTQKACAYGGCHPSCVSIGPMLDASLSPVYPHATTDL